MSPPAPGPAGRGGRAGRRPGRGCPAARRGREVSSGGPPARVWGPDARVRCPAADGGCWAAGVGHPASCAGSGLPGRDVRLLDRGAGLRARLSGWCRGGGLPGWYVTLARRGARRPGRRLLGGSTDSAGRGDGGLLSRGDRRLPGPAGLRGAVQVGLAVVQVSRGASGASRPAWPGAGALGVPSRPAGLAGRAPSRLGLAVVRAQPGGQPARWECRPGLPGWRPGRPLGRPGRCSAQPGGQPALLGRAVPACRAGSRVIAPVARAGVQVSWGAVRLSGPGVRLACLVSGSARCPARPARCPARPVRCPGGPEGPAAGPGEPGLGASSRTLAAAAGDDGIA